MRHAPLLVVVAVSWLFAVAEAAETTTAAAPSSAPNIVIILADDLGFADIGCYGSEIPTPNLDRLARDGARYTHFYNAARCCPTRASLLTGRYAHAVGVGDMWRDLGDPAYRGRIREDCPTIAEILRARGYRTVMSGKWQLGEERPHWPVDRGFERSYCLLSGAAESSYWLTGKPVARDDRLITAGDGASHITDTITDEAVAGMASAAAQGKPFFTYLAYTAPHYPLHAKAEDIARFKGTYSIGWEAIRAARHARQVAAGIIDARWKLPLDGLPAWKDQQDPADLDLRMAVYAAQVSHLDRSIGVVLDAITRLGGADHTIVMFLSDNGGCAKEIPGGQGEICGTSGSYMSYGSGWATVSNTPFRMHKGNVHEGGIASPLIVRWPGRIAKGTVITTPTHVIDIAPLCLEAAGASADDRMHGRPTPLLQAQSAERPLFWEHQDNRAVRSGDWKLVSLPGQPWELYDVITDRTETRDLATANPAMVTRLDALYHEWANAMGVKPWAQLKATKKGMMNSERLVRFWDRWQGMAVIIGLLIATSLTMIVGLRWRRNRHRT